MKIKIYLALLFNLLFLSCVAQRDALYIPEPDFSVYESVKKFDIGNILETKSGAGAGRMPAWLTAYAESGIDEIEKISSYSNKYLFVAESEGEIFSILEKWINNFTVTHDFPPLAAARIEKRMLLTSSLFPDDEYGMFFEKMIKNAYNTEYPGAVKEDTSWVRTIVYENGEPRTIYMFFILISIDKNTLQGIIRNMTARTYAAVTATNAQRNSISRLRQSFFEGF